MRKFKYTEYGNVTYLVTEEDIYRWWDKKFAAKNRASVIVKLERFGGIKNYPNEEKIFDHIAEHWSQEVFDLREQQKG